MKSAYKKVVELMSTYSFGNIAQNALYILLVPLYTSVLTPKDYGILALMTLTVNLITRAVSSPIMGAFDRFYYHPSYKSQNGLLLFNIFSLLLIKIGLISFIYWSLASLLCRLLLSDPTLIPIIKIFTIVLLLTPISSFLLSFTRLIEKAKFYVVISVSQFLISTILILYGLFVLKIGIYAPIFGNIVGLGSSILLIMPVLLRRVTFRYNLSIIKEPLKYGYPLIMTGYSNLLIKYGDRYVLRIFDSLSTIGIYSFGYTISSIINLIIVEPLKQGLLPIVFQMEDSPEEQKHFLASTATHYYVIGIFISLGLSLFAREAIMLIARRPEFWSAWIIVPLISFSYVLHGLSNFVGWGLVMKNKAFIISRNLVISAGVNIGLNFIFIPIWGIMGAAITTVISYLVWNTLKIYYSAKFYDLHFQIKRIMHITIIGIGLYLVSLALTTGQGLLIGIIVKLIILGLYFPILFISRFFSQQEVNYMKQFMKGLRTKGLAVMYKSLFA